MSFTTDLVAEVAADARRMTGPAYRVLPGAYGEVRDPLLGPLYVCAAPVPPGAHGVDYLDGRVCGEITQAGPCEVHWDGLAQDLIGRETIPA